MNHDEATQWMKAIWPHMRYFPESDYSRVIEFFDTQKRAATIDDDALISAETSISQISLIMEGINNLARSQTLLTKHAAAAVVAGVLSGATSSSSQSISKIVDLVLRIMLTLDIRSSSTDVWAPGALSCFVKWDGDASLSQAIASHFRLPLSTGLDMKTGRIDPSMTMALLSGSRNLKVFWTSNLADHLAINWKSRVVTIYEHKICLWNHINSTTAPIIPREILEEAIDTLNLLFPLNDIRTKDFLKQNGKPFYGLGYCKRDRVYDLEKFHYWRQNIADLMEIMNEQPRGLQQLALSKDGKNVMNFAAFWVAVLVAILTVISIGFGTIQTIYAVRAYDLALAQACSEPTSKNRLPQYCS